MVNLIFKKELFKMNLLVSYKPYCRYVRMKYLLDIIDRWKITNYNMLKLKILYLYNRTSDQKK